IMSRLLCLTELLRRMSTIHCSNTRVKTAIPPAPELGPGRRGRYSLPGISRAAEAGPLPGIRARRGRPGTAGDLAAGDRDRGRGGDRVAPHRVGAGREPGIERRVAHAAASGPLTDLGVGAWRAGQAGPADVDLSAVHLDRHMQDERTDAGAQLEQDYTGTGGAVLRLVHRPVHRLVHGPLHGPPSLR